MIKIYGADICQDCVCMKAVLEEENICYEYVDITAKTENLKEFLAYRDCEPVFDKIRDAGGIGIPFQIYEDGRKSVDSREILYEKYSIRPAKKEDLPRIMEIIAQAQSYLREDGVEQWQNGYPEEFRFVKDIEEDSCYLQYENTEKIIAVMTIGLKGDLNYKDITEGIWHLDGEYGVIHRMSIEAGSRGKGRSKALISFAESLCRLSRKTCMRIDTHADNQVMRNLLEKSGYLKCGKIQLPDSNGDPKRVAYDKQLVRVKC